MVLAISYVMSRQVYSSKIVGIYIDADDFIASLLCRFYFAAACSFDSLITASAMLLGQAA
jgi:hypothetical protein